MQKKRKREGKRGKKKEKKTQVSRTPREASPRPHQIFESREGGIDTLGTPDCHLYQSPLSRLLLSRFRSWLSPLGRLRRLRRLMPRLPFSCEGPFVRFLTCQARFGPAQGRVRFADRERVEIGFLVQVCEGVVDL